MNLSEAFETGGETAAIGLGIVFGVLVILLIVLYLFKLIFYKAPAKVKKVQQQEPVTDVADNTPDVSLEPCEEEDDEQLIAVITAAIAAALNTSTYRLNIKSIRRTGTSRSSWNRAGLNETISNRL